MARKKIGALLEEKGYITEFQLVAALSHQRKWKSKLGQSLIELGYLEENQLYEVLAEQLGMQFIDPRKTKVPPEIMKYASKELAREWYSVPIAFDGQTWTVATSDPLKPGLANKLSLHLKGPVNLVLATTLAIENLARKIADKVPVATVQPVKRAFVKDENGGFTPVQPPAPAPAPAAPPQKPQSDDDLFLEQAAAPPGEGSDNVEIPLEEFAPPGDQSAGPAAAPTAEPSPLDIGSLPAEPSLDAAFMDQAPAPEIPAPALEPEAALMELPPDELMEIEHEREPDLSEIAAPLSGLDEIPLEAAHESAAAIPVEETKESTDMIDLDELLPPPVGNEPAPAAEPGAEGPGAEGPPSLMDTAMDSAPSFDAPPLPETPPETAEAGTEPAPLEGPPLGESLLEAPPMDELVGPEPVAAPVGPPEQESPLEAPSLPDLGDLSLDAPPSSDSASGESSLDVPSLDSILAGVTGQDSGAASEAPDDLAPESSVEAPPLDMPPLSEEPAAPVEGPEPIETLEEAVTEEITDEAVPAAPAGEGAEEDSQEMMDKISLLEQQIKGMTDMLSGFKDALKDKKGSPKGKK